MQIKVGKDAYEVEIDFKKDFGTIRPDGSIEDPTMIRIHDILQDFGENDIFIDCGAHMGFMSMLIEKGTCYAIEANPASFMKMENNVKLNNKKNILMINEALYDSEIRYNVTEGVPTGMTNIVPDNNGEKTTMIGDDMFFDKSNIRLIKIDCEDSTSNVLKGLSETIRKNKPILIVEVKKDTKEIMEELNYRPIKRIECNVECRSIT